MLRLLSEPLTRSVYTCTQLLRQYLYCCTNKASKLRRTLMLRLLSEPLTRSVYTCPQLLRQYLYRLHKVYTPGHRFCVSICTFAPASVSVFVLLY